MRKLIGTLIILLSIVGALYLGGWVMFIGGIADIVDAIQKDPVEGVDIGVGILKIIFASFVGAVVFFVFSFVGSLFFMHDKREIRPRDLL